MILECPRCGVPLIGDYDDLLEHIDQEHPLEKLYVDGVTLDSVVDRIEAAKKQHRAAKRMAVNPNREDYE